MFKLNFIGAAKGNLGTAGFGGVIRDSQGRIFSLYWGVLGSGSNNLAELDGLLNRVTWAIQNRKTPLLIEGELMVIINIAKRIINIVGIN